MFTYTSTHPFPLLSVPNKPYGFCGRYVQCLLIPPYTLSTFSPSLISLTVSVDLKHHVYLLIENHMLEERIVYLGEQRKATNNCISSTRHYWAWEGLKEGNAGIGRINWRDKPDGDTGAYNYVSLHTGTQECLFRDSRRHECGCHPRR